MFLFFVTLFISLNLQGVYDGPELAREAKYTMYSIDDTNKSINKNIYSRE